MGDLDKILRFLNEIGIETVPQSVTNGFLPGVQIVNGCIHYDLNKVSSIGDILHDAGHVAVVPLQFRKRMNGNAVKSVGEIFDDYIINHPEAFYYPEDPVARGLMQAGENEAIAWSYFAALECGIDPAIVIHGIGGSYGGPSNAKALLSQLSFGGHAGYHGMRASKMCEIVHGMPKKLKWTQD